MASRYVDATLGDDSNAGTQLAPWKTIAKLEANFPVAGAFAYLKRGEEWRESLTSQAAGTSGNPITCHAYGTGDNPILNGADLRTVFTNDGTTVAANTFQEGFETSAGNGNDEWWATETVGSGSSADHNYLTSNIG